MARHFTLAGLAALALAVAGQGSAAPPGVAQPQSLVTGFTDPPSGARPQVWWHWMNGNITVPGLYADLDWMHRIGIGGVQIFEGSLNTPVVVPDRLVYMSSGWQQAFRAAAERAHALGISVTIATSPGWSSSGGPWVAPADAMKKLVWSEQVVSGGSHFLGRLPRPPDVAGPFQDVPASATQPGSPVGPKFYVDSVVLAYPRPPLGQLPTPDQVQSSAGQVSYGQMTDGHFGVGSTLPVSPSDRSVWVQYCYHSTQTVRAVTIGLPGARGFATPAPPLASLSVSDDGAHFRRVVELTASAAPVRSASFPAVQGRCYRLTIYPDPVGGVVGSRELAPGAIGLPSAAPVESYVLTEFELSAGSRVNAFVQQAGFAAAPDYYALTTPPAAQGSIVSPGRVVDLTGRLHPDGTLDWTAPGGSDWVLLRMGYSLTGHRNGPAPKEATGLEVDKLDAQRVDRYLRTYLDLYDQALGGASGAHQVLTGLLTDSIESGPQNWTDDLLNQFQRLRGYDPRPWLPALTGVIVDDSADTDRFLWDFRRTIAQLVSQSYYGTIAALAHDHQLLYSSEALEDHRPQLGDDMEMRSHADVPMGAMWTYPEKSAPQPTYLADLQGAASVAHVYGRGFVGAESMTAFGWPWAFAPRDLKPIADLEFALGVNRLMIHESTHQPFVQGHLPGLSLSPLLGQNFNRNETWADQATPWVTYLARSSYLLQQGSYAADIAYFYGEEAPLTSLFGDHPEQAVPPGYAFDFVDSDALLNVLRMQNQTLLTRSGTRYRLLYLGGSSRFMTLPVLRQIDRWLRAGLIVVGDKPIGSPSHADDSRAFHALADELWGAGFSSRGRREVGGGWLYHGYSLAAVLQERGIEPDWRWSTTDHGDPLLRVLHRSLPDAEIYFIDNASTEPQAGTLSLRVTGRLPELWHADSGLRSPLSYRFNGGRTLLPLTLDAHEACFIVLRGHSDRDAWTAPVMPAATTEQTLAGPWAISFAADRGAPASASFETLYSWTESDQPGIRYFSGTAQYQHGFTLPKDWRAPAAHVWLDLGDVRDVVTVIVNGRIAGTLWHPPYRLDVTDYLVSGPSQKLVLKITNLWVNRLIGDAQPGAQHFTFTLGSTYRPEAPLRLSGLLGPVRVVEEH